MNFNNSAARVARSRTGKVARIAKEIVDLVERTNGPVPLNRLDEHVPGFRASGDRSWSYFIEGNTGEAVVWNGMTKAGYKALRRVLNERQVALQVVNVLPYVIEDVRLLDPAWQPIVLLPIWAANVDGPNCAFRVPPALVYPFLSDLGADDRYRPLQPQAGCFTADRFCGRGV
jgi:hypothetical protein